MALIIVAATANGTFLPFRVDWNSILDNRRGNVGAVSLFMRLRFCAMSAADGTDRVPDPQGPTVCFALSYFNDFVHRVENQKNKLRFVFPFCCDDVFVKILKGNGCDHRRSMVTSGTSVTCVTLQCSFGFWRRRSNVAPYDLRRSAFRRLPPKCRLFPFAKGWPERVSHLERSASGKRLWL